MVTRKELSKPAPGRAAIVSDSQTILKLTQALPTWFPAGSGPEAGSKTAAKPDIWAKPAQFMEVASAIALQTGKLSELAVAGDIAAIAAQTKETATACNNCHKDFRVKDD